MKQTADLLSALCQAIALEHDLHPLALEDAVKTADHSHSKGQSSPVGNLIIGLTDSLSHAYLCS